MLAPFLSRYRHQAGEQVRPHTRLLVLRHPQQPLPPGALRYECGHLGAMRVQRVYTIARLQDGLITRAQALAAGATPSMIRHALKRDGPWQVILPGVYATFSGPLNWIHRLRAAVLHGGEGCMVTGPANCEMHGLRYGPAAMGNIDILVDEHCKVRNSGFVRVHRTTVCPRHIGG